GRVSYGPGYVPTNCPFCSASMDPQIKFCLDCGRNVVSQEEMSKLRTIQGVFTMPKVHAMDQRQPEFSSRTKTALAKTGGIFGIPRVVILVNLILIVAICGIYLMRDKDFMNGLRNAGSDQSKPSNASKPHKSSRRLSSVKNAHE